MGHAASDAERFENGFGNAEGETVEWADNNDAVVACDFCPHAIAHRRNHFAVDLRRECSEASVKVAEASPNRAQQIAALVKDLAVVCFGPLLRLIGGAGVCSLFAWRWLCRRDEFLVFFRAFDNIFAARRFLPAWNYLRTNPPGALFGLPDQVFDFQTVNDFF
jgi:hypothetical protein